MGNREWMLEAVAIARTGIDEGQSPFGSVVVKDSKIVSRAHNTVWKDTNPTAHAEVNAVRLAAQRLKTVDLNGCTVFTTCEPCPMCLAAIHWANASRVVYGATIEEAANAGFRELFIPAHSMVKMGQSRLEVIQIDGVPEANSLFKEWKDRGLAKSY